MERDEIKLPACRISSLTLDCGLDSQLCDDDEPVSICERGMRIRSRWNFDIGTRLLVSFVPESERRHAERLTAEGIVVWSEPCRGDATAFESTLLFLELPEKLKNALRDLSFRLASSGGSAI